MKTIERRQFEMMGKVGDFGRANIAVFPESSLAKEHFAAIDEAVSALNIHAATKMSAARTGRSTKVTARKALLNRLEAISETARAVGQDTPGLDDKFYIPEHLSDQAILTAGRVFARDAEGFTSQFIGHAMPATFIADLNGLIAQFEQAIHDRQAQKDGQTAARASIEAALARGFVALHKLDAIVTNHLQNDPVTMAVWKGDRRIDYRSRKRSTEKAPAPVVAAAASADVAVAPAAQEVKS